MAGAATTIGGTGGERAGYDDGTRAPASRGSGATGSIQGLGQLAADQLPAQELEAEICSLAGRLSAGTFRLLVLVGELDQRGTWATSGALSCAAWLADRCDIEVSTARTQVRVARAMREHPALADAMADGTISYAKARVMVPQLSTDNVEALVGLARTTPAGRLGAAIAAWSQRHEDPETISARQHEERFMSWRTDPGGTVTITTRLEPAVAGRLCAVVDLHVTRNRAPAGASLAQQRADALAAALTSGGAAVAAEVVVHVRGRDASSLADGTPLADHVVARLLPDAFVRLLVRDMARQPIDASPRRRFPTPRQRKVADERYPECAVPGCHARAFLQYDHIQPAGADGPTVVDNLQRLCGPHNRQRARAMSAA